LLSLEAVSYPLDSLVDPLLPAGQGFCLDLPSCLRDGSFQWFLWLRQGLFDTLSGDTDPDLVSDLTIDPEGLVEMVEGLKRVALETSAILLGAMAAANL
jgi:hypothetical protein